MPRTFVEDIPARLLRLVLQCCVSTVVVVSLAWPSVSWARSRGIMATACSGCHGGAEAATVSARFEPEFVEPGASGTLIVEVSADAIAGAGLAIFSVSGGSFGVPQGQPLTASGDWVTHTQAKTASGGKVEFRAEWTAPAEVGVALFEIAALAVNGNNAVSGDKPGGTNLTVGHGCEPMTMYFDSDGDGYGREDSWIASCGDDEGYVAVFGDCADSDPQRNPEASEVCNGLDDDCNGEVDEGVVVGVFYRDLDGDGFGDPNTTTETCTPEAGYVPNGDDCDDSAPDYHPDSVEACDYVDNNCDGRIDEDLRPTCGLGLCKRVSDVCGSVALCSPGEPFEEVCNSLDDDCDGETDEEGCPEGQRCHANSCVDVGSIPSSPPPASADESTDESTNVTPSDTVGPVPSTPAPAQTSSTEPAPGAADPTPTAGAVRSAPGSGGCSFASPRRAETLGALWMVWALAVMWKRRKT